MELFLWASESNKSFVPEFPNYFSIFVQIYLFVSKKLLDNSFFRNFSKDYLFQKF